MITDADGQRVRRRAVRAHEAAIVGASPVLLLGAAGAAGAERWGMAALWVFMGVLAMLTGVLIARAWKSRLPLVAGLLSALGGACTAAAYAIGAGRGATPLRIAGIVLICSGCVGWLQLVRRIGQGGTRPGRRARPADPRE